MTVEIEGIELEVDFEYNAAERGFRDSWGAPIEPDYPESVDINSVMLGETDIIDLLSKKALAEIEERVLEYMKSEPDYDDEREAA